MQKNSFKDALRDWRDIDYAMHDLAVCLGLVDEEKGRFEVEYKWIYWATNPCGDMLYKMLMNMVEIGYLIYDDEEQRLKLAGPDFECPKRRTNSNNESPKSKR